jgi:hypothetical protein
VIVVYQISFTKVAFNVPIFEGVAGVCEFSKPLTQDRNALLADLQDNILTCAHNYYVSAVDAPVVLQGSDVPLYT